MLPPIWTVVWLSTAGLLPPATHFDVLNDIQSLQEKKCAVAVAASTAIAGNYLYYMTNNETIDHSTDAAKPNWLLDGVSTKTVTRVTEQNVIISNGKVLFIGAKFLAPFQWMITSKDLTFSTDAVKGTTAQPPDAPDDFTSSTDSTTLMAYVFQKVAATGRRWRLYKGDECAPQDNYSFTFPLKK